MTEKELNDKIEKLISESNESPCIDCLEKARANYAICIQNANGDPAKEKICLDNLNSAIKKCPCN